VPYTAEERVQRRLAAILAADVVGYSRLMERDEAGTLAALKSRRSEVLRPTLDRHRGRVVKFIGDGVLVEFVLWMPSNALFSCSRGWKAPVQICPTIGESDCESASISVT
jgi:hypothetical protein